MDYIDQHGISYNNLPNSFYVALGLLAVLTIEALRKWRRLSGMFSLVAYFTVFLWYIVDVRYSAEQYVDIPSEDIEMAFWQVCFFMLSFRLCMQIVKPYDREITGITADQISSQLPGRKMAASVILMWVILFTWGLIRMNGDIIQSLYPVGGRWSPHMWARGALGGAWDWLIAAGGYLYIFVCGLMGLLFVLVKDRVVKWQMLFVISVSWPYYFLLGTRNKLLAVICPALFSYLLLSKAKIWKKTIGAVLILVCLNYAMLAMLQFRQKGFHDFLKNPFASVDLEAKHQGLNMIQELAYINGFYKTGQLQPEYGREYLAQALNIIPRSLWPEKPTLSFTYSTLRGHGAAEGGVTATISTGLIGQGAVNFGTYIGPLVAGLLLALYGYFLIKQWRTQSHPFRFFLFIMGMALVPNMGREFTLLVLWPVVFGAVLLRILEKMIPAFMVRNNNHSQEEHILKTKSSRITAIANSPIRQ